MWAGQGIPACDWVDWIFPEGSLDISGFLKGNSPEMQETRDKFYCVESLRVPQEGLMEELAPPTL